MDNDGELLVQWRGGDRQAGSQLFRRHFASVLRFFANKVEHDVEDLVQRTFAAVVEGRDRFEQRASFRTYLFAIAHNVLRSYLRTKKRNNERLELGLDSVFDLGLSPTVLIAQKHEQTLILQALRRLTLEQQIMLELYFWEQLSGPELADLLQVPEGTIRSRIRRSKDALEEKIRALTESDALVHSTLSNLDDWAQNLRDRLGDLQKAF